MDGAWRASGGNERLEGAPRAAGTPRGDHWSRAQLDARQAPRDLLRRGLRCSSSRICAAERQLGRAPRSLVAVAARCPYGRPSVLVQAPYSEAGEPFPTLYWLSCPALVQAIGRFEASGGIELLTGELARDPELAADHDAARAPVARDATRARAARTPARRRRGPGRRDCGRGSRRRREVRPRARGARARRPAVSPG